MEAAGAYLPNYTLLWDVTLCSLEDGTNVSEEPALSIFKVVCHTLEMEGACSFETLLRIYQTTRRHMPIYCDHKTHL
jgi:hypothetical protein